MTIGTIDCHEAVVEMASESEYRLSVNISAEEMIPEFEDQEEMTPEFEDQIVQARLRIIGGQEKLFDLTELDD